MKYLIEATVTGKTFETYDGEIITEIAIDGGRENTSIVFSLEGGKYWWIPISELDHLMSIVDSLVKLEIEEKGK